jgi:Fe-S cluster assembly ATPase SufC
MVQVKILLAYVLMGLSNYRDHEGKIFIDGEDNYCN